MASTEEGGGVTSVQRALDVLELVGRGEAISFSSIQNSLGIPRSSLFHLLRTLTNRGFLDQKDRKGAYGLGPNLISLTGPRDATADYNLFVNSLLGRMAGELNETAGYYELRGTQATVIDTVSGRQVLLYSLTIGDVAELHAVSAGKILLANLPDQQIDALLSGPLERFTSHTITSKDALWDEIRAIRRTGIAYSREERRRGIGGMAVAATNGVTVRGAFGVALPILRLDTDLEARIERQLRAAAKAFQSFFQGL